jgi:ectoine hydroxylase-related dioxygenase (phytanoyl-CoA dioxygenase family)
VQRRRPAQALAPDEARASDGASPLIRGVMRRLDGRAGGVKPPDHGFVVHPGVLTDPEIESLLAAMAGLCRSRAGVRYLMRREQVAMTASDPRLLDLASTMLGAPAIPYRATLFDKSPGANWLVVWHQDTALPLQGRRDTAGWGPWSTKAGVVYAHAPASALERVVALRVHLDDSTSNNGPLRVIPGSHRLGVLSDSLIQEVVAGRRPHECTVARGGVLAMRPLLVHASSKWMVPAPRRVLHIEYASTMTFEPGLRLHVA